MVARASSPAVYVVARPPAGFVVALGMLVPWLFCVFAHPAAVIRTAEVLPIARVVCRLVCVVVIGACFHIGRNAPSIVSNAFRLLPTFRRD